MNPTTPHYGPDLPTIFGFWFENPDRFAHAFLILSDGVPEYLVRNGGVHLDCQTIFDFHKDKGIGIAMKGGKGEDWAIYHITHEGEVIVEQPTDGFFRRAMEIQKEYSMASDEERLETALRTHDWTYEFSDDRLVWERGNIEREEIKRYMTRIDAKRAAELWDQYYPESLKEGQTIARIR